MYSNGKDLRYCRINSAKCITSLYHSVEAQTIIRNERINDGQWDFTIIITVYPISC